MVAVAVWIRGLFDAQRDQEPRCSPRYSVDSTVPAMCVIASAVCCHRPPEGGHEHGHHHDRRQRRGAHLLELHELRRTRAAAAPPTRTPPSACTWLHFLRRNSVATSRTATGSAISRMSNTPHRRCRRLRPLRRWFCAPLAGDAGRTSRARTARRSRLDRKARVTAPFARHRGARDHDPHGQGTAIVIDFMPRPALDGTHEVVRIVQGVRAGRHAHRVPHPFQLRG